MTTATEDKEKSAAEPKLTPEQDRIRSLFDSINPGDKVFVYRVASGEQRYSTAPLKVILTDFQAIDDLEAEIFRLANDHGWESGEYMLRLRQNGRTAREARLSLEVPPRPTVAVAPAPVTVDPIKAAETMISASKMLAPQPTPPADPMTAVTAFADAFQKFSATQGGILKGLDLSPILNTIVQRLTAPPPEPAKPLDVLTLVKQLREAGLVAPLADANARGEDEAAADPLAQIQDVLDLVERLQGRLGGGAGTDGGATHWAVEVARIIVPVVPQALRSFDNFIDTARMSILTRAGQVPPNARAAAAAGTLPPSSPAAQAFLAETQVAIAHDDDAFFVPLAQGIIEHFNGGLALMRMQQGQLDEEPALGAVAAFIDVRPPKARAYFLRFFHWLRQVRPLVPPGAPAARAESRPEPPANESTAAAMASGKLIGKCRDCGAQYSFDNVEHYQGDTKLCDEVRADGDGEARCHGTIDLVPPDDLPA